VVAAKSSVQDGGSAEKLHLKILTAVEFVIWAVVEILRRGQAYPVLQALPKPYQCHESSVLTPKHCPRPGSLASQMSVIPWAVVREPRPKGHQQQPLSVARPQWL